jgi:hypothetical protein
MRVPAFSALLTDAGREVLAGVDPSAAAGDPLATASRLRENPEVAALDPDLPVSELVNAVMTQVSLRERGRAKFGEHARGMFFTPNGLEQSTRWTVAEYRAGRTARHLPGSLSGDAGPGGASAGDLCCGIGADLLALAGHGVPVEGVDADPLTVAVARANIEALGLSAHARVREGDVNEVGAGDYPLVFCDPARRGGRGRVFDPAAYSPPWDVATRLAEGARAACLKAAPGIPHEVLSPAASAEWISVDGELKETALWFGALGFAASGLEASGDASPAGGPRRRATVLHERAGLLASAGSVANLDAEPGLGPAPVAPARRYLYDPDPAVVRSHLVAEAAARVDGALLDERIAYFTSDRAERSPLWRVLEVLEFAPFSLKRLRSSVRAHKAGTVTIKKRGSAVDTEKLRRDLRASGPESVTIALTRIGERPFYLLCREVEARQSP